MQLLFDKGIEKREDKKCWWGRRFNFNEPSKEESPKPKCSPKKDLSQKKSPQRERRRRTPQVVVEPRQLDASELVRAKGAILLKMNDIFGKQDEQKYMKFIDTYFALGEERIINLYMEQ